VNDDPTGNRVAPAPTVVAAGAAAATAAATIASGGADQPAALRRLTDREKVIRAFIRDDRLVSIPAKPRKRDLLLPLILDRCFPDDREYQEKEVNMRLALLHPDVAALRRYLVDGRLMTREAGIYRRARPMAAESPTD
jgi:hypothetical protein